MSNFYGTDLDYIHIKFGNMRKAYNFTNEFREKYPNFCAEYELYWEGDEKCRFKSPLQIAQYVDMYNIPVKFYYNFTDTPSNDITDVYEYIIREYGGITYEANGSFREDYKHGLDGEVAVNKFYKVMKEAA